MPIHSPESAGKPYRPSNGTEGMMFEGQFCDRCKHAEHCEIQLNAMVNEIDSPDYPPQWKFDDNGLPACTAFAREE